MLVHLALLQDLIAGAIGERPALIWRDRVFTYAALNARSRRVANGLRAFGLGCRRERAGLQPWASGQDHVALYLYNGNEFLESMYGAFKARAVPINVNYRYVEEELYYVLANSEARAIVFHASLAPRVAAVRGRLPQLRHFVQVADESGEALLDGAVEYEAWLHAQSETLAPLPYTPDDLYILYTGGTTGLPKGVVWRHEDVFYNGLGGHIPGFARLETEAQMVEHINAGLGGTPVVAAPFMHGAGQWSAINAFHRGGTVILPDDTRRLDAHGVWRVVERYHVDQIGVIGDSFALPLLAALKERTYDVSSVRVVMVGAP